MLQSTTPPSLNEFRRRLLSWYDRSGRDLPWRRSAEPYRVWISETMLQQTRVDVVRDRYLRFLSRFPDLGALARAEETEVVAEWSGLGYYRRARSLHAAARRIVEGHGGEIPRSPEALATLPGIGRYTASAVASIAYGTPVAVVDGNVERVLSRLFALTEPTKASLQKLADRLLHTRRPGDWNQAMMELGAIVCTPARPSCDACPVRRDCEALARERVTAFPSRRPGKSVERIETTVWIVTDRRGRIWMERRRNDPLKGLWVPPWRARADGGTGILLGAFSHAIMSRRYHCEVRLAGGGPEDLPGDPDGAGKWVAPADIAGLPTSSLTQKAIRLREPSGSRPRLRT